MQIGPWWRSSGRRAHLLLGLFEFESSWSPQFILFENKRKRGLTWPILKQQLDIVKHKRWWNIISSEGIWINPSSIPFCTNDDVVIVVVVVVWDHNSSHKNVLLQEIVVGAHSRRDRSQE